MSYNYNQNPWDDNYTDGSAPYNNQATGYNTASGYNNPTAQYQDDWNNQSQQYYGNEPYDSQQQQQPLQPISDQQGERPAASEDIYAEEKPTDQNGQSSYMGRFLRAHVPLCGTCMDFTSPFFDAILKYVNRELLVSKVFYFFFYSAFGSLFPLMGVYFKQLGMNPAQVGIITGVRPFIEIFSAPFWNNLAEKFQKSKILLLFSLISWIVFTYSLAHIRPPASACVAFNDTDYVLYTPYSANDLSNYDVGQLEEANLALEKVNESREKTNEVFMNKMPSNNREKKDEILVDEENVNDQGRRRRRRKRATRSQEQIKRPELPDLQSRYVYTIDGHDDNNELLKENHIDFDIDLVHDFDDEPIKSSNEELGDHAFFDQMDTSVEHDPDELEQQNSYADKYRFKRFVGSNEYEEPMAESRSKIGQRRTTTRDEGDGEMGEDSIQEASSEEANEDLEAGSEENENGKENKLSEHGTERQSLNQADKISEDSLESGKSIETNSVNKTKRVYKQRHKTPPTHIVGMSPITVEYAVNYNREKHSQFVTPMFSTIVYKLDDIKEVFFLLLLLISLGEFFSAPAITIADSITLSNLGENTDLYGRQRMFGSIGWAITLLLVGMALDNSKTIADHPCGPHQRERSYTVCFTIFSLLMGLAFLTATQFTLRYAPKKNSNKAGQAIVTKTTDNNTVITTTVDGNLDDLYASTRPREIFNTAPPVNAPPPGTSDKAREKFEFLDKWKSAVFAQSTGKLPEWINVFRQFSRSMHLMYLFITWFLGCGVGLVFTFLFWHLQDVGGTPTLFGICSVINHISEVLAYFFSSYFIKRYGHTKVSQLSGQE